MERLLFVLSLWLFAEQTGSYLACTPFQLSPRRAEASCGGQRIDRRAHQRDSHSPGDAFCRVRVLFTCGGPRGRAVEHIVDHIGHVLRGGDSLFLFNLIGAEFQQDRLRIELLVVIALADDKCP